VTTLLLLAAFQVQTTPSIQRTIEVDGVSRRALVFAAKDTAKASPLVFVFHGFTGNALHAAGAYKVHQEWPEATVVYPQGLEVSLLNRKGPGWQIAPRVQEDRDVKFFDALLADLKKTNKIDDKRIYTCGMSNGAIFSYVLLSQRGSVFAAAAPVGGFAPPAFNGAPSTPILIIHGKADDLISVRQAERSRDLAVGNNKASDKTKEWEKGYTLYPGAKGHDVVYREHEGGHTWPAEVTPSIVKFFKQKSRS